MAAEQKETPNFAAIDLPRRTMYWKGERFVFQQNGPFSLLVDLSYYGQEPRMSYQLDSVLRSEAALADGSAASEVYFLRKRVGDDGSLIVTDSRGGYSFSAPVIYGGYPEERYGWQNIDYLAEIKSPLGSVKVKQGEDGVVINKKPVHLGGLEEELVWNIPNTGEHIISPQTLTNLLYGEREINDNLHVLIYTVNSEKLRPIGVEIASVRGKVTDPVLGYYLRDLKTDKNGYKRESRFEGQNLEGEEQVVAIEVPWKLERADKFDLNAFKNFFRLSLTSSAPIWERLLEDTYSIERMQELVRVLHQPLEEAYTPQQFAEKVLRVYDLLLADSANMSVWPEDVQKAWKSLQTFKKIKRITEDTGMYGLRSKVKQLINYSKRSYDIEKK